MEHSSSFLRCLRERDVAGIMELWAHVAPQLPQPKTMYEAEVTLHYARTLCEGLSLKHRAYSHAWLLDHGHITGLPDELKTKAERMYPRVVDSVGVSVKALSNRNIERASAMERAMADAVADAYAEGRTDPAFVKGRIQEVRRQFKG